MNGNLNHIRKLYTLLARHCNCHGDCARHHNNHSDRVCWQDCGVNFISLDVLCWVHAGEQETESTTVQ